MPLNPRRGRTSDKADLERYKQEHGLLIYGRLESALQRQAELSNLQKERDVLKSKANRHQRERRQQDFDTTVLNQLQTELAKLETSISSQQSQLRSLVWQLPNWIDPPFALSSHPSNHLPTCVQPTNPSFVEDPIFCIGGYESLSSPSQKQQCVVLTGPGCELQSALKRYFQSELRKRIRQNLDNDTHNSIQNRWDIPLSTDTMTTDEYHDTWGCSAGTTETSCPGCKKSSSNESTMVAPPWLKVLRHQSKSVTSYFDRHLPILHVVSTFHKDPNDGRRENEKRSQHKKWYNCLAGACEETIQLVIVTGPSVQYDVQPLLCTLMNLCLLPLYQELSPATHLVVTQEKTQKLQPFESSRWVLRDASTNCTLAYISNLQDYVVKLRHHVTKESCMVLQGTVCNLAATMDWMARWNTDPTQNAMHIPPVLRPYYDSQEENYVSIPFCRTLRKGKGGRKVVVQAQLYPPKHKQHDDMFLRPTPDRIRAEAATAPSSFLPFYCK